MAPAHQSGDLGEFTNIASHHGRVDLDAVPVGLQGTDCAESGFEMTVDATHRVMHVRGSTIQAQ